MRLHDWNGDGLIEVGLLPRILMALLTFRADWTGALQVRDSDVADASSLVLFHKETDQGPRAP